MSLFPFGGFDVEVLCKIGYKNMRVQRVEQNQTKKPQGMIKAGAIGAAAGALVRNFAPLTKDEHDVFFNKSALNAIKEKAKNVRINEANKIVEEIADNRLQVSNAAGDIFSKNANLIATKPKEAGKFFEGATDAIKEEGEKLISRVVTVGAAKEHTEITNIKTAAKQARPLAYFVAIGTIVALTGKLIMNTFNDLLPEKEENKPKEKQELTMADALLEGLGSNTEVLLLASNPKK